MNSINSILIPITEVKAIDKELILDALPENYHVSGHWPSFEILKQGKRIAYSSVRECYVSFSFLKTARVEALHLRRQLLEKFPQAKIE